MAAEVGLGYVSQIYAATISQPFVLPPTLSNDLPALQAAHTKKDTRRNQQRDITHDPPKRPRPSPSPSFPPHAQIANRVNATG